MNHNNIMLIAPIIDNNDNPFLSNMDKSPREWQLAEKLLLVDTSSGEECLNRTSVSICTTEDYILVRYVSYTNTIIAKLTDRNSPVWSEEAVEIFLQPPGQSFFYYEIDVNPLGTVADLFVINNNLSNDERVFHNMTQWNCKNLLTRVHCEGIANSYNKADYWIAEFQIPIRSLYFDHNKHQAAPWRANFYRIDYSREKPVYQAWSPTGKINFHLPQIFGEIYI